MALAAVADVAYAFEQGTMRRGFAGDHGRGLPDEAPQNHRDASPAHLVDADIPQRHIVGGEDLGMLANARSYLGRVDAAEARLDVVADASHFEIVALESAAWQASRQAMLELAFRQSD